MNSISSPSAASASALQVSSASESNRKIRSACNRCHSQKLRCTRQTAHLSCERCLKLNTSCRLRPRAPRNSLRPLQRVTSCAQADSQEPLAESTSPFVPTAQSNAIADESDSDRLFPPFAPTSIAEGQAMTHQEPCYPLQGESIDIQEMYWPDFSYDSTNATPLSQDGTTSLTSFREDFMDLANSLPSPRITDIFTTSDDVGTNDRLQPSPPSAIRNLASLNLALCECAENLPSPSTAGLSSAVMADNGEFNSRKARLFAIDELFRITTSFIDVVQCLSRIENKTSANSFSTTSKQPGAQSPLSSDTSSQGFLQGELKISEADIGPQSRSLLHLDSATKFMVASCHCRLTEIYISLFRMMQACIEHVRAPRMGKDWAVVLPQLQVGSIASPSVHVDVDTPLPSGASSMYMLMITMLSSGLCEQLADVMRVGNDVPTNPILESRYFTADTVWDTVIDGTDRLVRIIEATKYLLRQHSTSEH